MGDPKPMPDPGPDTNRPVDPVQRRGRMNCRLSPIRCRGQFPWRNPSLSNCLMNCPCRTPMRCANRRNTFELSSRTIGKVPLQHRESGAIRLSGSMNDTKLSVFFDGNAAFANLEFNSGRFGFFAVDINPQADDSDEKGSDDQIQSVTVQCFNPVVRGRPDSNAAMHNRFPEYVKPSAAGIRILVALLPLAWEPGWRRDHLDRNMPERPAGRTR